MWNRDARKVTTACARCSDSALFASADPTVSVCPSIRNRKEPNVLLDSACPSADNVVIAAGVSAAELVGNCTERFTDGAAVSVGALVGVLADTLAGVVVRGAVGRLTRAVPVEAGAASDAGGDVFGVTGRIPRVPPIIPPDGRNELMIWSADGLPCA